MESLIGKSFGCLTLVQGDLVAKQREKIEALFRLQREHTPRGEDRLLTQFEYELRKSDFDIKRDMQKAESSEGYICQCKCGHIFYMPTDSKFLSKNRKYCDTGTRENYCGLRRKRTKDYPREKHPSYSIDFTSTVHDTLYVLECIDEHFEETPIICDGRKKGEGKVIVQKRYKCRCQLCGKEYQFLSSDFEIKSDAYGPNAERGYYSIACCKECHKTSSFQWRTIKIFKEYNIKYQAEKWFQDLINPRTGCFLRYDFAILDSDNRIKYLIECQGEQHFKPSEDFGGMPQYNRQVKSDELKRDYAKQHNYPLVEIPYNICNTLEKETCFLVKQGILNI